MKPAASPEELLRTDIKIGLAKELLEKKRISQPQFILLMELLRGGVFG